MATKSFLLFACLCFGLFTTAQKAKSSAAGSLTWSGYTWKLRNTVAKQGPGPNLFSQDNAWVDEQGYLHLLAKKNRASGRWTCAELTSDSSFGFGTYEFLIEGKPDKMDKNLVLGLFNYSGNDGLDEMDIEFARWGKEEYPNLNYTIWPAVSGLKPASSTHELGCDRL